MVWYLLFLQNIFVPFLYCYHHTTLGLQRENHSHILGPFSHNCYIVNVSMPSKFICWTWSLLWWCLEVGPLGGAYIIRVKPSSVGLCPYKRDPEELLCPFGHVRLQCEYGCLRTRRRSCDHIISSIRQTIMSLFFTLGLTYIRCSINVCRMNECL